MDFSATLINWYQKNKRDLPWRSTTDAYVIWLSEIILQQTRVAQGTPYFYRFLEKYPTVSHFAAASEDEILNLWQGLGYYSRGRNMLTTARLVQQQYNGVFPSAWTELIKLKGIGEYTAAAIASFAANEAREVVDGNVYRVLARYFNIATPINSTKGQAEFKKLAAALLDIARPALHNQAVMEFGALVCKPANPACGICPIRLGCWAFKHNAVKALPVKLKKTAIKRRYFNYLLIVNDGRILLHKRGTQDIWANLYELPLIETIGMAEPEKVLSLPAAKQFISGDAEISYLSQVYNHKLTHQHLVVRFIQPLGIENEFAADYFFCDMQNLKNFALPQIIFIFLANFLN